jgi:hypothetical protein
MGVVIGVLSNGDAPCVESPKSPEVTIGVPESLPVKSESGNGPVAEYGYISPAREMKIKRTMTCKKADFPAVSNWLSTLSGGSVEVNCGADGTRTIGGEFMLDGEMVFSSVSPSLMEVQATFIGKVMDCNFLLPSGLAFTKIDPTTYAIVIDDVERQRYTATGTGDGSGLTIRAGGIHYQTEIDNPASASLQPTFAEFPNDASDTSATGFSRTFKMASYREINLCVNGEVAKTWHVPCNIRTRHAEALSTQVWYGTTDAEFDASGIPVFTEPLDLSDATNDRLSGGVGVVRNYQDQWFNRERPITKPVGIAYSWYGYQEMLNDASWSPDTQRRARWPFGETYPYKYRRYWLVGLAWVPRYNVYGWGYMPHTQAQSTVILNWLSRNGRVQLVAQGSDGLQTSLLDFVR